MSGRKKRAKRRGAGEEIVIGRRARLEKVWGGDMGCRRLAKRTGERHPLNPAHR